MVLWTRCADFLWNYRKSTGFFDVTLLFSFKLLWSLICNVVGQASERVRSRKALEERKVQEMRAVSRVSEHLTKETSRLRPNKVRTK